MWGNVLVTLTPLLLSSLPICHGVSRPGKPIHLNCRSPEKETFTCRWEPGSDGGLPTTYRLYYQRENSDETFECPDYQSEGEHSCFFNQTHTFIWVAYNITIEASNSLGRIRSDPLEVDVMNIVYPNAPENLTATVVFSPNEDSPYLLMTWEPPHGVDVHSGWTTPTYQLGIKRKKENKWEEYISGTQTQFVLYSLSPGSLYMVQVQCKLDHGLWSEWGPIVYADVPNYIKSDKQDWIVVGVFLSFIFLVGTFILSAKRKYIKDYILPPVPGPKIRGFDIQLLKSGKPDDILSAVFQQGFPPTVSCNDQLEYLLVFDEKESKRNSPAEQRRASNFMQYTWQSILHLSGKASREDDREDNPERWEDQDYTPDSHRPPFSETPFISDPPSAYAEVQFIQNFSAQQQIDASENTDAKSINYIERRVNNQDGDEEPHKGSTPLTMSCPSTSVGYVDIANVPDEELSENQLNYSKVSGVDMNNVLLLQREIVRPKSPPFREKDDLEALNSKKSCYFDKTGAMPVEVNARLIKSGYVDTMPM